MDAIVLIADGSEDIETVTIIDTLRRADLDVTVAAIGTQRTIRAARGTVITADALLADCADRDARLLAVPGGVPGATAIGADTAAVRRIDEQLRGGRWVGAICAAPALVLAANGLLDSRPATGYPAFADQIPDYRDEPVVIAQPLITSQGPATALAFSLALVRALVDARTARSIGEQMLCPATVLDQIVE